MGFAALYPPTQTPVSFPITKKWRIHALTYTIYSQLQARAYEKIVLELILKRGFAEVIRRLKITLSVIIFQKNAKKPAQIIIINSKDEGSVKNFFVLSAIATLLAGCAATTTFEAMKPGQTLQVKDSASTALPRTEDVSTVTFGAHDFKAMEDGKEPLYGILPLHTNINHLVWGTLFFAPADLWSLREVETNYQFDLDRRVVRFKKDENSPWKEISPTPEEAGRAKKYFDENAK